MALTALMPERFRHAHQAAFEQYLATWHARPCRGAPGADGPAPRRRRDCPWRWRSASCGSAASTCSPASSATSASASAPKTRCAPRSSGSRLPSTPTPRRPDLTLRRPLPCRQRAVPADHRLLPRRGHRADRAELGLWRNPRESTRADAAAGTRRRRSRLRSGAADQERARRASSTVSIERIELDGQPCLLHSGQDVTERRLAENAVRASEARLRALSARLESAREEEGRRIAREIHDELGGTLTTLKWDLDGVAKSLSAPVSAGEAERIRKTVPVHAGSGGVHHDAPCAGSRPTCGPRCWTSWASWRPSSGRCGGSRRAPASGAPGKPTPTRRTSIATGRRRSSGSSRRS